MSLWTLIKLIAALCVMGIMAFTGMLAWHVAVQPLGGVFSKLIPAPVHVADGSSDADFAKMLDAAEMPDIDPGEKSFQKAHELLALGKLDEAREKLNSIITTYPTSAAAPLARRIVGEMSLDEILSSTHMEGKKIHVVKRGDSFLGIAGQEKTSMDCIMHLNSMMELKGIQPGEELVVMPLEFSLFIEPRRKCVSLWDGGRFICEYPALHMATIPTTPPKTTISSKSAELDGKRVAPQAREYRAAGKVIQISKPSIIIRAWDGTGDRPAGSILLRPRDMEELNLLTRVGNTVEIR